jgi:hypothetical protein
MKSWSVAVCFELLVPLVGILTRWRAYWSEGWWWEEEKRRGAVTKRHVSFPRIVGAKPAGTFPIWNVPPLRSHSLTGKG